MFQVTSGSLEGHPYFVKAPQEWSIIRSGNWMPLPEGVSYTSNRNRPAVVAWIHEHGYLSIRFWITDDFGWNESIYLLKGRDLVGYCFRSGDRLEMGGSRNANYTFPNRDLSTGGTMVHLNPPPIFQIKRSFWSWLSDPRGYHRYSEEELTPP